MKFALLIQWDENQPTWTDADQERPASEYGTVELREIW